MRNLLSSNDHETALWEAELKGAGTLRPVMVVCFFPLVFATLATLLCTPRPENSVAGAGAYLRFVNPGGVALFTFWNTYLGLGLAVFNLYVRQFVVCYTTLLRHVHLAVTWAVDQREREGASCDEKDQSAIELSIELEELEHRRCFLVSVFAAIILVPQVCGFGDTVMRYASVFTRLVPIAIATCASSIGMSVLEIYPKLPIGRSFQAGVSKKNLVQLIMAALRAATSQHRCAMVPVWSTDPGLAQLVMSPDRQVMMPIDLAERMYGPVMTTLAMDAERERQRETDSDS